MAAKHADRIWMIGGVVGAALLLIVGWFVAISPKNAETQSLREQKDVTESRLITLRHRLAELQDENKKLEQFKAALKRNEAALPADSGVPDLLRQLQDSGELVDVTVSGFTVSAPVRQSDPAVYALPITVTAGGKADNLGRFLDQLQQVQPRAVLIESTNLAGASGDGKADPSDAVTMTLTMKAFVAPAAGQPVPTVTATN
jgi:type IV pilus assembly protein PilO